MISFSNPALAHILLLSFMAILLSACSDSFPPDDSEDVNTLNLFTTYVIDPDIDDPNPGRIYSFDPETSKVVERDSFKTGDETAIWLNTNDDNQGFEYVAYVKTVPFEQQDKIFLLDAVTGEIRELAVFQDIVCGVRSLKTAASGSIDDSDSDDRNNYLFVDLPTLFIEVAESNMPCSPESNNYVELSFVVENTSQMDDADASENEELVTSKPIGPGRYLGAQLVDFNSNIDISEGNENTNLIAETATAYYNISSQQLEIYHNDIVLEANLNASEDVVFAQVTEEDMLLSLDYELFLVDIDQMLSLVSGENQVSVEVPTKTLDDLFNESEITLDNLNYRFKSGRNNFVLEDGDSLKLMRKESTNQYSFHEFYTKTANLESIDYFVTDSSIFLHKSFADYQLLTRIVERGNPGEFDETTLVRAKTIVINVDNDTLYINSFDPVDLDTLDVSHTGWRASQFVAGAESSSSVEAPPYDDSLFALVPNINTGDNEVMILSTDTPSTEGAMYLPNAELYLYDSDEENGRRRPDNQEDNSEPAQSFGMFSQSVSGVFEEQIINDKYGYINILDGASSNHLYFFDPSEPINSLVNIEY